MVVFNLFLIKLVSYDELLYYKNYNKINFVWSQHHMMDQVSL